VAGIVISKALQRKLPEDERVDIEEFLWSKSGGKCHLCERNLNRASDEIEADHDQPEAEGGSTSRENLLLAHRDCNRFKRNNPTVDVRPYLKFSAFVRDHGGMVRYDECVAHFDLAPKPTKITEKSHEETVDFEFPDGSRRKCRLHRESNRSGDFTFAFVDAPAGAIFNDDDCQPRNIKLGHLWSIYVDLQKNPLHEPPGCRLIDAADGFQKLCMFDGQHKTVASWMRGYKRIVVKVYLTLDRDQTIHLVNSVQAKIKKLPLSPFELSAKLAEEWREQLERYEEEVGSENASEHGFIRWLAPTERTRGRGALQEAILQDFLTNDDLLLLSFVHRAGAPATDDSIIKEATFKNKVLKVLVHLTPLDSKGQEGTKIRRREMDSITRVLNLLTEAAFQPEPGAQELSEKRKERRRRLVYQSSLVYVAELLKRLVAHTLYVDPDDAFISKPISKGDWEKISSGIQRLVDHPIWSADFEISDKTRAVKTALLQNQPALRPMEAVGLKPGYLVGADKVAADWHK
jgi:hypothetical protein